MQLIMEIIGWLGGILILIAYGGLALNKFTTTSLSYQLINLFGAILLVVFTIYKEAYPPATVNIIWAILAIITLFKRGVKSKKNKVVICDHEWFTDNHGTKHCMICHEEK